MPLLLVPMAEFKHDVLHEDLNRGDEIKGGSNRSFGLVFAAVFAIIALWPLTGGGAVRLWALGIAVVRIWPSLLPTRSTARTLF